MRVKMDYGKTGLDVEIPDDCVMGPLSIKPAPALNNPSLAIRNAMENPIGTKNLLEIARAKNPLVS
jgi:hypothetical protein